MVADFILRGEGRFCTVYLLTPVSDAAQLWVEEHIPVDAQVFAGSIVVEHRYIEDILEGIRADRLTIEEE